MKVLIVYTHPHRKSLNGAFLDKTIAGLESNGSVEQVDVLDLYKEGFDPRLVFNEEERRRDLYMHPDMEKYREQINRADTVVFIYPIWWGRPPAMLLGYVDRLFTAGFAYKVEAGKSLPVGLMKGKRAVCISTMQGPAGYIRFFLGNVHKILMKKALFNFVGIRNVRFFEFGSMESAKGNHGKKLERIKEYMSRMEPVV